MAAILFRWRRPAAAPRMKAKPHSKRCARRDGSATPVSARSHARWRRRSARESMFSRAHVYQVLCGAHQAVAGAATGAHYGGRSCCPASAAANRTSPVIFSHGHEKTLLRSSSPPSPPLPATPPPPAASRREGAASATFRWVHLITFNFFEMNKCDKPG